jgi:hypothetical protein
VDRVRISYALSDGIGGAGRATSTREHRGYGISGSYGQCEVSNPDAWLYV